MYLPLLFTLLKMLFHLVCHEYLNFALLGSCAPRLRRAWVKEINPDTVLSEKAKDGLQYSINQAKYLRAFLEDGEVPMDNSAGERSIRPFCVERSNWHVIDAMKGAQASAIVYSIVETAKANNLKPYEYLQHLLSAMMVHLYDADTAYLQDLMPWSENLPDVCKKTP